MFDSVFQLFVIQKNITGCIGIKFWCFFYVCILYRNLFWLIIQVHCRCHYDLENRSVQISEFIKNVEVLHEKCHFCHFFLCGANGLVHQGCSVIVCNRAYQDESVILKFKFNLAENCTFHDLRFSVTMVTQEPLKYG